MASKKIKETEFLVIDFETLTPAGRSPEPIELGIQKINGYELDLNASVSWLIRPPEGFHITRLDIALKGIRECDLAGKPNIDKILEKVNRSCMKADYIFIAQNAKYEANILSHYTEKYQGIAKTPVIDTVLLAKYILPDLPNYKLDTLAHALNLAIPKDRHRALADCILTAQVFTGLLEMQKQKKEITYLDELLRIAGIKTKYNQPIQMGLFDSFSS